ncbi:hypothetical protein NQ317_017873 [Molorchus minor]|uniref:Uncharacterized protein n=1 Tax=Molorchus minor TaxID=1323400 RepID=A0ABQ9JAY8_9CUCU|nr:hypothetical protein NQ317_017873 [Molorchus minor]
MYKYDAWFLCHQCSEVPYLCKKHTEKGKQIIGKERKLIMWMTECKLTGTLYVLSWATRMQYYQFTAKTNTKIAESSGWCHNPRKGALE